MDRNDIDRIDEIYATLQSLVQRVGILESELAALKGEPVVEEASDEPIDLSLDDLPVEVTETEKEAEVVPEETPAVPGVEEVPEVEDIPAVEDIPEVEDIPVDIVPEEQPKEVNEPVEEVVPEEVVPEETEESDEPFFGLLEDPNPVVEVKKKTRGKAAKKQPEPQETTAVIDVLTDKYGWKTDLPGQEVKDVRSAISLNDRVMFIVSLFREDSALYADTLTKINAMKTLDEVVKYVSECFPEWKMDSDMVYRFMMAVRRKIRN